uniref:Uncharacterized protein n=1 Tax=Anguilla anguilla TaxID=7936 RepID=A0A0E9PB75_ANGAN
MLPIKLCLSCEWINGLNKCPSGGGQEKVLFLKKKSGD